MRVEVLLKLLNSNLNCNCTACGFSLKPDVGYNCREYEQLGVSLGKPELGRAIIKNRLRELLEDEN